MVGVRTAWGREKLLGDERELPISSVAELKSQIFVRACSVCAPDSYLDLATLHNFSRENGAIHR